MKYITFVLLCLVTIKGIAQDPFDKNQRNQPSEEPLSHTPPSVQTCQTNDSGLATDIPLQQLKLVGMIQFAETQKALLLDPKQQILSVQINDILGQEKLKLHKIEANQLQFRDCHQNNVLTLTF